MGLYPTNKKKGEKCYYSPYKKHSFTVPKINEKGEKVFRTNQVTGVPLTNLNGEPEFVEETIDFKEWKNQFTEDGYWCVYVVSKDTPKHIAAELLKDAKDRKSMVLDEDAFIELTNPDLAIRMKEDIEKDTTIKSQADEIAALRAQLAGKK